MKGPVRRMFEHPKSWTLISVSTVPESVQVAEVDNKDGSLWSDSGFPSLRRDVGAALG